MRGPLLLPLCLLALTRMMEAQSRQPEQVRASLRATALVGKNIGTVRRLETEEVAEEDSSSNNDGEETPEKEEVEETRDKEEDNPAEEKEESTGDTTTDGKDIEKRGTFGVQKQKAMEEDQQEEADAPLPSLPAGAKNLTTGINININATAMTLSACEQIEMILAFLTSLDFDQHFWQLVNFTNFKNSPATTSGSHRQNALWELYLLQAILGPISLAMTFAGSSLLHPACCLAASIIGVFLVFHLVDFLAKSKSPILQALMTNVDCAMKLALSVIAASISAMLASTCLRFGLFSLGALAAGSASYLVFDAFPYLDPTRQAVSYPDASVTLHGQMGAELSPFGWIVTTLVGLCGGVFLRWYEQASLEVVTAAMGGLGLAYSLHTYVIMHGGQLNRSLVFLLANFIAFSGWRVQRSRRFHRNQYSHKKNEDQVSLTPGSTTPRGVQPSQQSWEQLQASVNGVLQRSNPKQLQAVPSQESIVELTKTLNSLLSKIDKSQDTVNGEVTLEDSKET